MNMHKTPEKKTAEVLFWIMAIFAGVGIGAIIHALITWMVPVV